MRRPNAEEYAPYYETYVGKVKGEDYFQNLLDLQESTTKLLSELSEEEWNFRYAPDKWSVKEVMIHILDTERIFVYRALRIGRNDKVALPGFEQNDYVNFYNAENRSPKSILSEYQSVRNATLELFKNFRTEDLDRVGTASGFPFSVLALGFITAGHEIHHVGILKERYLE